MTECSIQHYNIEWCSFIYHIECIMNSTGLRNIKNSFFLLYYYLGSQTILFFLGNIKFNERVLNITSIHIKRPLLKTFMALGHMILPRYGIYAQHIVYYAFSVELIGRLKERRRKKKWQKFVFNRFPFPWWSALRHSTLHSVTFCVHLQSVWIH